MAFVPFQGSRLQVIVITCIVVVVVVVVGHTSWLARPKPFSGPAADHEEYNAMPMPMPSPAMSNVWCVSHASPSHVVINLHASSP